MSEYVARSKVETAAKISAGLKRYNEWKPLASKKPRARKKMSPGIDDVSLSLPGHSFDA
jgi:hypothetical protein